MFGWVLNGILVVGLGLTVLGNLARCCSPVDLFPVLGKGDTVLDWSRRNVGTCSRPGFVCSCEWIDRD